MNREQIHAKANTHKHARNTFVIYSVIINAALCITTNTNIHAQTALNDYTAVLNLWLFQSQPKDSQFTNHLMHKERHTERAKLAEIKDGSFT